ncbi:M24 family metallopeptidase [Skermania piniformis]|uniref:Xaa-Pro peptidase family protein n=1 Tax=Skermania pinensis TaxID=39122 RepID=A0ABX8SCC2_9ACTN|nr:Xaa-Pro peptidase family protein [Skermania piniformis]QXQ15524.1 Xaa-Pro peptidase family protein [Skermania piniformis]
MNDNPLSRFAGSVYADRLDRAAAAAAAGDVDGLLITPGPDLRYLIGSTAASFERLTCLIIPADGSTPTLLVPRLELAGLGDSAVAELDVPVLDWVDGDDPYALVAATLGGTRAAVADATPALHVIPLAQTFGALPVLATPMLRQLRMIKDRAETDELRRAGAAIDRVHARMAELLRPGRTEAEVGADIADAIVAEGHTAAAFVIVGSGRHGADPHHEVSDKPIEPGEVVVIDIGGPLRSGYNSDCTRTYVLGEPSATVTQQYAVLERAQAAARAAARPGITAEGLDAVAREVLMQAGLADKFIHRTGHGIGLSVHEEPYIVAGSPLELTAGMAFSIEPGIYFPGAWGARIEDIVVLTADGCELLNQRPRELVVLD